MGWLKIRDVMEFKFKCCMIPSILCKSEIQWIIARVYVEFIFISFWSDRFHALQYVDVNTGTPVAILVLL